MEVCCFSSVPWWHTGGGSTLGSRRKPMKIKADKNSWCQRISSPGMRRASRTCRAIFGGREKLRAIPAARGGPGTERHGGIWHHQLARAENTSWTTHVGVCLEQIDCLWISAGDERRILLRIPFDVLAKMDELADRPAGPDDSHFGAFVLLGELSDYPASTAGYASIYSSPLQP